MPKPPTAELVSRISIFVSSSSESDAEFLRGEVDRHAARLNVQLRETDQPFCLDIFHWNQLPSQNVPKGQINRMLIARALACHEVVALLVRYLRRGTKEEIQAAYEHQVPLSVLLCPPRGRRNATHWRLRLFLRWLEKRNLYKSCGDPRSTAASEAIYDTLIHVTLKRGRLAQPNFVNESR
jgi:hypothetical protein